MLTYFSSLILAQSAGDAAKETANQTRELLTRITTGKIVQAIIIILVCVIALMVLKQF